MIGHYEDYNAYENALKTRLKNLVDLFNKQKRGIIGFPISLQILGFTRLVVKNEDELLGRIKELSDCLHLKKPTIKTHMENSMIEEEI